MARIAYSSFWGTLSTGIRSSDTRLGRVRRGVNERG